MKRQDATDIHRIAEKIYGKQGADALMQGKKNKDGPKGFYQPLPDMVGLKQHDSECASDSIQEVMLFADEIREYMQPILYGLTKEQIELRVQMALDSDDWLNTQDYLYFIQKRFHAHYDVINYLRTHKINPQNYYDKKEEVCGMNPLFKKKERTSLEAGILALKHYKKEIEYTGTGLNFNQTKELVANISKCLKIPFTCREGVAKDALGVIMHCHRYTVRTDSSIKRNSLGHVVSFIKMNGKWAFYDDYEGLTYVDEALLEALEKKELRIVIYKKPYFVKQKGLQFESAYANGKWDTELVKDLYENDWLKRGIYYYDPHSTLSVISGAEPSLINDNHRLCGIGAGDLKPKNSEELSATITKFRSCIYNNLSSNSGIFENLFKFASDSIDLVKETPEVLSFLTKTIPGIVLRPAFSPMSHYWCYKIGQGLKGAGTDSLKWFDLPKLKSIYLPSKNRDTPLSFIEKLKEIQKKADKNNRKTLTPCGPGQVRNAVTKKCREREKRARVSRKKNTNGFIKSPTKKSRCPKGEVRNASGACVKRESPCPPGQKRDKETRLCIKRVEDCPEGQVRDPKTKKCREQKAFKF